MWSRPGRSAEPPKCWSQAPAFPAGAGSWAGPGSEWRELSCLQSGNKVHRGVRTGSCQPGLPPGHTQRGPPPEGKAAPSNATLLPTWCVPAAGTRRATRTSGRHHQVGASAQPPEAPWTPAPHICPHTCPPAEPDSWTASPTEEDLALLWHLPCHLEGATSSAQSCTGPRGEDGQRPHASVSFSVSVDSASA